MIKRPCNQPRRDIGHTQPKVVVSDATFFNLMGDLFKQLIFVVPVLRPLMKQS